jgi:hypothetical protein
MMHRNAASSCDEPDNIFSGNRLTTPREPKHHVVKPLHPHPLGSPDPFQRPFDKPRLDRFFLRSNQCDQPAGGQRPIAYRRKQLIHRFLVQLLGKLLESFIRGQIDPEFFQFPLDNLPSEFNRLLEPNLFEPASNFGAGVGCLNELQPVMRGSSIRVGDDFDPVPGLELSGQRLKSGVDFCPRAVQTDLGVD